MKSLRIFVGMICTIVLLTGCVNTTPITTTISADNTAISSDQTNPSTEPLYPIAEEPSTELTFAPIDVTFWYGHTLYTGTGYFKFAILGPFGITWTNDGSNPPVIPVPLDVERGQFSLNLGDTALEGMSETLSTEDFPYTSAFVHIWFSPDEITWMQLPDKKIISPFPLSTAEFEELWNSKESDFRVGHTFIKEDIKTYTLRINDDGTYTGYDELTQQETNDSYSLDGNLYVDYFERSGCQGLPPATFKWLSMGNWLTFQLVGEDPCSSRREDYDDMIWMLID